MRGIEAGLDGGLEGFVAEVGEETAHRVLAGVDNLSRGSLVDGVGDLLAEAFKAGAQEFAEGVRGELGLGVHGRLQEERGCGGDPGRKNRTKQHFRVR